MQQVVAAMRFQTSLEVTKSLHHIILLLFKVMTPKSDFLLIGDETVTPKGSMNRLNFGITSLFVEQDYEQQTNTRLWFVRANK